MFEYLNPVSAETITLFAKDTLMSKARLNAILWGPAAAEPVVKIWITAAALCRHSCCFLCVLLCCYFQKKKVKKYYSIYLFDTDPSGILLFP